jgi:hypothetical protein
MRSKTLLVTDRLSKHSEMSVRNQFTAGQITTPPPHSPSRRHVTTNERFVLPTDPIPLYLDCSTTILSQQHTQIGRRHTGWAT